MTDVTRLHAGIFSVSQAGRTVMSTEASVKSFNLVPDSKLYLSGATIQFPDFDKDVWYHFLGVFTTGGGTVYHGGCESYTAILNQEWSADSFIGNLPPYTDYLHVRMAMGRSGAPSAIGGQTLQPLCVGQWTDLDGGAMLIETLGTLVQRMVGFFIDAPGGTSPKVYMRRKQSVKNTAPPLFSGDINAVGYTAGVRATGIFANVIVSAPSVTWALSGAPPSNWLKRGGTQSAPLTPLGDWTSIYTGDIEITPGRVFAA